MRHTASIEQPTHLPARYLVVDSTREHLIFASDDSTLAKHAIELIPGAKYMLCGYDGTVLRVAKIRKFERLGKSTLARIADDQDRYEIEDLDSAGGAA